MSRTRSVSDSPRGGRLGVASMRSISRTGLARAAPWRTASPMTPLMTILQVLAVAGLMVRLIVRITRSTKGVVTSLRRTAPIAGRTWLRSWRS